MAKKENGGTGDKEGGMAALLNRCLVENCRKKGERMSFCQEHYLWYKEGLVNKSGKKPKDFDKKYQNYLRRHKPAA